VRGMSRYSSMASAARKARLRPVLLASFSNRALLAGLRRTEKVCVFICFLHYSTARIVRTLRVPEKCA
jgi:hypothetical protein